VAVGLTGLAHLQNAALEVIAALRAGLDMAEDLVRDPAVANAGGSLTAVITRVFEALEPIIASTRPGPTAAHGEQGDQDNQRNQTNQTNHAAASGPPDDGPVEHIRVS
jgi:hypothetical protein